MGLGSGALVSTLLLLSPATSAAVTLSAWQFDPTTQQLTLTLPSGVVPQYAIEAGTNQLVIELPQTQLGDVATEQAYEGAIQRISLSQVTPSTVQIVLDLSPETTLAAEPVQLVSMTAGEQTRWVITPLVAPAGAVADVPATAPISGNGNGMIVELPTIPAADSYLAFPAVGTGRLSTSAANLMLPSDIDNLANLPETLPIDPFNIGFAGQGQVSVPSLEDLDAAVGTAPALPPSVPLSSPDTTAAAPTEVPPPTPSDSVALTTPPPARGAEPSAATEPTETPAPTVTAPALPALPPVSVTPAPTAPGMSAPDMSAPDAPIDSETTGVPIPVQPSVAEPAPAAAVAETPPAPAEPAPAAAVAETPPAPAEPAPAAAVAETPPAPAEPAPAAPVATPPATMPGSAPVMVQEPPAQTEAAAATEAAPATAIAVDPPPGYSPTTPVDQAPLAVPTAPGPTATPGLPAELPPPFAIAAGEAIPFGAPLPGVSDPTYGAPSHGALPQPGIPPSDRPVTPDTLIAAGTVLALRYPGSEARPLGDFKANEVMLLQNDIRDPITQGVLAPAGSQLIGHFEPGQNGQRWVSHTLITPNGQRVPLASNTEYFIGPPDIDPGMLALGTGAGALAMTLLTGGFGAFAVLGGALAGATTAVGTSPHLITLEPNQVIHVQVIQDVPRAMPVAAAPERSREWGTPSDW